MNAEDLVVGDIVFVKFGDRLPADIRIIEAKGFKVHIGIYSFITFTIH
jgi:sodium/potassium-transporting ATPase subunit alpha